MVTLTHMPSLTHYTDLLSLSAPQSYGAGAIVVPIWHIRKLRHREDGTLFKVTSLINDGDNI